MSEKSGWAVERTDVPIDLGTVEALLEPWRGARVISEAVFLRGGLMNRNYRVRVGSDDVVLRFYDRDARACAKETTLLMRLRGIIPVPELLYMAPNSAPVPFSVMEFVDGVSLRTLKKHGPTKGLREAAYEMGHYVAKLSRIPVGDEALFNIDLSADPELLRGPNVNARIIDHFLASPVLQERLGVASINRVRDFAWREDTLVSAHTEKRGIVHGDLNSANILVREKKTGWTVSAILDWEFAFVGSMFHDIGNFLRYERPERPRFEPQFSRGLCDGGVVLPPEWRTVARLADLPALCELLGRPSMPPSVVSEIRDLILACVSDAGSQHSEQQHP